MYKQHYGPITKIITAQKLADDDAINVSQDQYICETKTEFHVNGLD